VPEQVGSDDGEILFQQRHQLFPASPGPKDPVDEHHDRAAAGLHVVNVVAVQRQCEDGGILVHELPPPTENFPIGSLRDRRTSLVEALWAAECRLPANP